MRRCGSRVSGYLEIALVQGLASFRIPMGSIVVPFWDYHI